MRDLDLGMLPGVLLGLAQQRVQLYCFVGFLMYYADCMLVFRMTIYVMASGSAVSHGTSLHRGTPPFSIIFGCARSCRFG